MVTSAGIYHILHALNITIEIRNVCVFLAPLFSSLTVIATYHLTKELKVLKCTCWYVTCTCTGRRRWALCCCHDSHCSWIYLSVCRWFLWQRRDCYILYDIHLPPVDKVSQDWVNVLVYSLCPSILLYGNGAELCSGCGYSVHYRYRHGEGMSSSLIWFLFMSWH